MPSHALNAAQSRLVAPGHGKIGYVDLRVTVAPEVKDRLIALATRNGTWVMEEVRAALESYLEEFESRSDGSPSPRVAVASDNGGSYMTEEQFSELRDYYDGMSLSTGHKPSKSLIRNGWLRLDFDDFYKITAQGKRVIEGVKAGTVDLR